MRWWSRGWLLSFMLPLVLASCGADRGPFVIVSGSENKSLQPLVMEHCQAEGWTCEMRYLGSLDIGLGLALGTLEDVDAVWPANSIWIDLYDRERRVKHAQSISLSPVILGVQKSRAEALGWIDRDVTARDIVDAIAAGDLPFLMTSATQSNSGASAYLAMVSASLGHPPEIAVADLEKPEVRGLVESMLAGQVRSSGSSGWLADLYLDAARDNEAFAAMWNYEVVLAEVNAELAQLGQEPLWAIYPADGVAMADSPLGYLERSQGEAHEAFFLSLQEYLLSDATRQKVADSGRRVPAGAAEPASADPSWNFDPARFVATVRMPAPDVIAAALDLYQGTLRRPSFTVYCLDFSGSMEGEGERSLKEAMRFLLTPDESRRFLVQSTPDDRIVLLPFSAEIRGRKDSDGTAERQRELLDWINATDVGGGTDMYRCGIQALDILDAEADERYLPAVVMMTDGKSEEVNRPNFDQLWRASPGQPPVFGITFGDADRSQLELVGERTRGRVFDGTTSLTDAFRASRGYN